MKTPMPESMADMVLYDATEDIDKIAAEVDFVFCAVDMNKGGNPRAGRSLRQSGSARWSPTTPPTAARRTSRWWSRRLNADHIDVIPYQREAAGHQTGLYRRQIQLLAAELCARPVTR